MRAGGKRIAGWIVVFLGALFLLQSIFEDFSAWGFIAHLWPLLLILIGLYIIVNRGQFGGSSEPDKKFTRLIGELRSNMAGHEIGDLDFSIFIGELRVDLRESKFLPGKNCLRVSMGMGETQVLVPPEIPVKVTSRLFAGELNYDELRNAGVFPSLNHTDDEFESAESKLDISLDGFVGEMTIKKY